MIYNEVTDITSLQMNKSCLQISVPQIMKYSRAKVNIYSDLINGVNNDALNRHCSWEIKDFFKHLYEKT